MKRALMALVLLLEGCSVVFDPSSHQQGGAAADAGDAPDSGDAGLAPVSAVQFCPQFVERFCEARAACCEVDTETAEDCQTRLVAECTNLLVPFASDSRNAYQPDRAARLLSRIGEAAASCDLGALELYRIRSFAALTAGTIPVGEPCQDEAFFGCNEPTHCVRQGAFTFACELEPAAEGELCFSDIECGDGLRCRRAALSDACQPLIEDEAPCSRSDECLSGRCGGGRIARCLPATRDRVFCPSPFAETIGDI